MYPNSFNYLKPSSLPEALTMLSNDSEAKLLAGSQSLIPSMKLRLANPSALIDISGLAELKGIRQNGNNLHIGAGVTHSEIEHSDAVKAHAFCLADAARQIGDMMIRNLGTIGGSVAHADPAADYPGVLVALDAKITVIGGSGSRELAAADFFTGFFETALDDGEIVSEIIIPSHQNWKSCYIKFPNPASRYPIVGCAIALHMNGSVCREAKIGFSGVGYNAFRDSGVESKLNGATLSAETVKAAAGMAAEGIEVLEDSSADAAYRKQMAKVFTERGINGLL